jgi:hypothetical protein
MGQDFSVTGTESEAAIIDAIPNLAGDPPSSTPLSGVPSDPWDSIELVTAGFTPGAQCVAVFGVPRQIVGAVAHDMEGYEAGALATWNQGNASAHLSILRDGHIVLNVRIEDVAWHAGTSRATGRTPFWQTHNANPATLSFELEGFAGQPYTDAQAAAVGKIARWAEAKYGVQRIHTFDQLAGWHAHSEISNQRRDPGPTFNWDWVTS